MIKNYQLCLLLGLMLFTATGILDQPSKNDTQLAVSEDLTDTTTLLDTAIPEDATGVEGETGGTTTTGAIPEISSSKATLMVTVKDWLDKFATTDATSISSVSSADLSAAVTEEPTKTAIPSDILDQKTQNDIESTIPEELDDTTRLIQLPTTLLDDGITEDVKEGDVITDDFNTIEADSENTPAKTTMMVTEKELDATSAISLSAFSNDDLFAALTKEPTETAISTDISDQHFEKDTKTTVLEDPNDTTDQLQFKTTMPDDATMEDAMMGEFYTDGLTTTVAMSQTTPGKTTTVVTEQEEFTDVDVWSTTSPSSVSSTTSPSTDHSTTSPSTVFSTELPTTITEEPVNASTFVNDTLVELNETETSPNQTLVIEVTTTIKPGRPPPHPCLADIDEGEPEFQRYICVGNVVVSYCATIFLLTLILFGVSKTIAVHGCLQLLDVRRPGVSFPSRPEVFVLLCSTLPLIFSTLARPIFWPYHPRYYQFINELALMQARLFFDLFTRTASVYHLVYWAYRMPIIRFIWRTYLRFKAFRAVWTKEHIIEVLQDKFAPPKDTRLQRAFQNNPEYMYFYAQFLQSGLPMQYLQLINKSGARSPADISTAGFDGLQLPGQPGSSSKYSPKRQGAESKADVLQRVNLSNLMVPGSEGSNPRNSEYASFLGTPSPSINRMQPSPTLQLPSSQLSRGPSFRSGQQSRYSPGGQLPGGDQIDKAFGQHLSPDDALLLKDLMRTSVDGRPSYTLDSRMPNLPSPEFYLAMFAGFDTLDAPEKKKKEEEEVVVKVPPPTREFVYICKHALPGVIYILSLIITFPSIFAIDTYQYESTLLQVYFFYDMIFVVLLPMVAIIVAFYHGALAKVQLNGGPKMRYRLRCYYVNFVVFNIPMLILMMTICGLRWTDSHRMENERFATGVILALTVYHTNFVIKSTAYATGCNCICCSAACLRRCPRINTCIVRMTTPKVRPDQPTGPFGSGTVIQVTTSEAGS